MAKVFEEPISGPHWRCRCGDDAGTATGDEAMAGAAMHLVRKRSPRCRSVRAFDKDGVEILLVSSGETAAGIMERYLSPYRDICCREKLRGETCLCPPVTAATSVPT